MATLNIVTTDLTTVNRTRINLYKEPDRLAIVDSLIYDAPHPQRQWTFYNLEPSQSYFFRWTEIDGSALDIQTLADAIITLPAAGSIEIKAPQEIVADFTPGWVSAANTVTMDGTSGTDDWRTWDIHLEKVGFGTQFTLSAENYTWDPVTGILTLTDAISPYEKYWVEFEPKVLPSAPVINLPFTSVRTITANATILATDFGTKLILIEGASPYLEVTLPPISTVVELRQLHIKTGRISHSCAAIVSSDSGAIDWLQGARTKLYMGICESLIIFRIGSEWHILNADGNFKIVGERVSEFAGSTLVYNKIPLDGTICTITAQARLFYDYVNRLPSGEVVTYAAWSTGDNKYKYSLADGSGNFHVPDLRDLFERQTDGTRLPGQYQADMVGPHTHEYNPGDQTGLSDNANDRSVMIPGSTSKTTDANTGTETRPKNYATRAYVRC
jgi:hypothetical protein